MKHLKRFFCPNIPPTGKIVLDAEQSNHLKNTLRLEITSEVEIFSNNKSYLAKVASINNSGLVELTIISRQDKELPLILPEITLACAIAKGSRMDWLIEKTAELGLAKLIPLITERTIVRPEGLHKIDRWRKLAIAAAKQCGQDSILDITSPITFNNLKDTIITNSSTGTVSHSDPYSAKAERSTKNHAVSLIALPNAERYLPEVLKSQPKTGNQKILYLIGPEGDFTPAEADKAVEWGAQPVRLPLNAVLRVETAAIAMLAMIFYETGKMNR